MVHDVVRVLSSSSSSQQECSSFAQREFCGRFVEPGDYSGMGSSGSPKPETEEPLTSVVDMGGAKAVLFLSPRPQRQLRKSQLSLASPFPPFPARSPQHSPALDRHSIHQQHNTSQHLTTTHNARRRHHSPHTATCRSPLKSHSLAYRHSLLHVSQTLPLYLYARQ